MQVKNRDLSANQTLEMLQLKLPLNKNAGDNLNCVKSLDQSKKAQNNL